MKAEPRPARRWRGRLAGLGLLWSALSPLASEERGGGQLSAILGRPTDRSVTVSLLSETATEAMVEWTDGKTSGRSAPLHLQPGLPGEIILSGLRPDTAYRYHLSTREGDGFRQRLACSFHSQRQAGSAFTFTLQGDSHPERLGRIHHPELYARTLDNISRDHPDLHLALGDDFSLEPLARRGALRAESVDRIYARQRDVLQAVGCSAPLFLVNGNHDLLDVTDHDAALLAGSARNRYFPLPDPEGFYSGDRERVEPLGWLRDYYAWNWGDALFVVLDPYWHSFPKPGEREGKRREGWQLTLGETQYRWLSQQLSQSRAKWKFVFIHHLNGAGRGGIEASERFEWGGNNRQGEAVFHNQRPGWSQPVHDLLAAAHVTIVFQGHDHLYARQQRDGVVYQTLPNPADAQYRLFDWNVYRQGDIRPNSGHVRVTVSAESVQVDYVKSCLISDEARRCRNGEVAHSYRLPAPTLSR
ncbi:MAG: metallophosphoesterase [Magnetococcales bacterium]|nr:metallophosphoesterase [Magnetococcales bacterium]